MPQFLICNQDEVESKLKILTNAGTSDDGLTQFYKDKTSNEEWHLTQYDSEYHGGIVSVLKRLPEPTIEELIDIATTSLDINDIIGASLELSERERYKKEDFRDKLLNRLLQVDTSTLNNFEKKRFKIIIYESDLYDSTNRRNIVGKHFTEIQKDSDYYQIIANKAKKTLVDIEKYSS